MAAGIINTKEIQLQFLLNHSLFNVRFNPNTKMMDNNPQGNNRKEDGLCDVVAMSAYFIAMRKIEKISGIK